MTTRVFLHVGSPKTGTTFLQNVLWRQRSLAKEQGLLLPQQRFADHYLASLDVRGLSGRPVHPRRAVGMWSRIVEESLAWDGQVLISHELFAATTRAQAQAALAPLIDGGAEVHIVLTARDLVRQITAEWQEHVKHRSTATFADFVRSLREDDERQSWFWRVQDFASVVERWGADLPPSRLHVVTVPPKGTGPTVLWERFAGLLGLEPASFDLDVGRSNTSLGAEQAELLRRVNVELGDRLPLPGPYPLVVKNVLAHRVLESRRGTGLALNAEDARFARDESTEIATRLTGLGVDLVGDVAELAPEPGSNEVEEYAATDPAALLDESVAALADLLTIMSGRLRRERAGEELAKTAREKPVRFALVQASAQRPVLRKLRAGFTRARGLVRRG